MKARAERETETLFQAVKNCKAPDQKVYLVGGAVRDMFLGLPVHDFDFVVQRGSRELAKCLRKTLHGVGFALDDTRGFNRVILNQGEPEERSIDLAEFVGEDLSEDLRSRDFTLNAMAVDLDSPEVLIDPFGGRKDLKNGILKIPAATSFENDPLRVLRAVRMMQAFHLRILPEDKVLLRVAATKLREVSSERVRDELFKILLLPNAAASLRILWQLDVLSEVFPCVPRFEPGYDSETNLAVERRLSRVAQLEKLFARIEASQYDSASTETHPVDDDLIREYKIPLKEELNRQLVYGRKSRELLILLAFLLRSQVSETMPSSIQAVISYYKLSNDEARFLTLIEQAFLEGAMESARKNTWNDQEIFFHLKRFQDTIPGFVLVALAFVMAEQKTGADKDELDKIRENLNVYLATWFDRRDEILTPHLLMNGTEILAYGNLKPGPVVGKLLDALEEAQFLGQVLSLEEAKQFVSEILKRDPAIE